jgi:hypothetical protein
MTSYTATDQTWVPGQQGTANPAVLDELEATTRVVAAAHDGHVHEAIRRVRWERRGLLQRLRRAPIGS